MDVHPSFEEMVLRLALATVFGGVLGLEREWRKRPAGLRTHMMVSLGSAAFTLIGLDLFAVVGPAGSSAARVDPLRLVEAVATGIGFLGAGSIIRHNGTVEGLTTAGSLWLAGAMGLCTGGGLYGLAGVTVVLAWIILAALGLLEARFEERRG